MTVIIDGTEYIAKPHVLPDRAVKLLSELYTALWGEGIYDPFNEYMERFARPLAEKMLELNGILQFRK